MPLLDQIDKNPKDNHIDIQELQDAIKPEGFLTKEENIKGVSVELNTSEKEPIAKTLEDNLTKEINNILTKNTLTDADIKIIDLWVKLFGSNTEYTNTKQDLSKKLDTLVTDIAHNVGKIIAANTAPNKENYTATDIKQIQLRANLHFGANVAIDGKRGSSINLSQNTPNAQLTNLYIYRLELTYRKDIVDTRKSLKYSQIFEHMLQTPNLEAALNSLPDQQSQNKVFLQFLDFYLKEIKQAGMFFEDKIGGSVLSVLFIYMVNAEKYKDDQVQSKFYIDQITKTKKEIKDFNQNNIDANDSVAINDRLKALDKLGVNDKPQKIKLYQELLDLCTKTNNQDLKGNLLIRISTTFTEAEIKQNFGTTVVADLSKTRDKISEDLKKYEKTNDILSQIENKKIGKRSLSAASRKEYAATRPGDANANQKGGLIGTFGDRPYGSRGNWKEQGFKTYTDFENSHVPSSVYKLQMPGAEPVIVRMPDVFESESIQSLIKLSNNLDANTYLVSPDYTKEFSAKGWGNGGDGYNYKTMDHAEKDKNILDFDDFAIAKKQKNGDITLHKIKGATSYEVKPYETITLDQQHKASQTSNLALRSTYTPEAVQSFTDLGDIQTTMGNIQTLYDKMGTAKIDWKNTNVFGAIFAMTNPMAAPLLNTYIPVEGGLSSKDEKAIYTQATEMKLKIIDLRKQENKLISLRDQIQKMEKNIDKSKIITPEERKIMQALDAINFLIQNIKPGGSFEEFINYMTNPKYVGTNGTFTALGMEWIKNNGLKFICAIGMAVAVIAAIPSGGASLLTIAAIGTVGGMAGSRLGQRANEGLQNTVFTKEVIIDGKVHTMVYNDPTDIKLLSEGKLSPQDFAMSVGREFAVGTVSMFGFMKAGQIIGNSISKFMLANESSPITTMLRKVPKLNKMNDPYTTNIFETIAKKGGEKGFFNKFSAEFGEEIVQEGGEGVANTISEKSGIPGLAMLVTTWNSLTPGVNTKIYENNNVSVASIDRVGDNAVLDLHYAGNINELIQHFEKNGFILNADGTLSKPNAVAEKITDVIKLTPSMASIDVRNMDALFGTYGMQIDHTEANKVNFPSDIDPIKLKEFQDKFEHSGMGTVVINPDGSFDVRTMDKTIQFVPTISNAPSPAIDIVQDVENNIVDEQFDPQAEPTIFDAIVDNNVAAQKVGLFVAKFYGKLQNIAFNASSITNEVDLSLAISSYVVNNVKHFVHEVKHIFGSQLVDVYKAYIQAKKYEGKPGGVEFRTIFNKKFAEWGGNCSRLLGETILAKFGIDPHTFFWGGHLLTGLLKDNSNTLDHIFHMSFETMKDMYAWSDGRNATYNPKTVVENSMLDITSRSQALIDHLGLDPSANPEHQKLLDTLLEVHEIGKGEAGKDARYSAGVYNYTPAQLKQKMLLLEPFMDMDIGGKPFRSQVRDLFALGFLGTEAIRMPDIENNIDGNNHDPIIAKLQDKLTAYINSIPDVNNPDRQSAEKMKKQIDDILSGYITFDNYIGIRNLKSKAGKLDIENEMLPLVQKILENTKNKYPNNPEKRDIQKLIDVDGVLSIELGMDVAGVDLFADVQSSIDYLKNPNFTVPEGFVLHNETNPIFNNVMGNIKNYIDKVKDGSYISTQEKQTLLLASSKFVQYALDSGLPIANNPQQIFDMVQTNLKKLMYQDIKDRRYLSGSDHGILHIVNGDMFAAIGMIEGLPTIRPQEKLMILQMITDHDLGYTLSSFDDMINNGSLNMFFEGTKDHPIYSRVYTESMRPQYEAIFGKENVDIMFQAMLDHSDIHTTDIVGLSKGNDRMVVLQSIIANADCLGVTHVDKTPALYLENPGMMGLLQKIQNLHDVFKNTNLPESDRLAMATSIKKQMADYIRGLNLDPQKEIAFLNAIEKTIDPSNVGFSIGFNYSSFAYSFEKTSLVSGKIQVNMGLNTKMFAAVEGNFGDNVALANLKKVMGDYGLSPDTTVTIDGISHRYGDLNSKQLFDLMKNASVGSEIVFHNAKGNQVSDFVLTVKEPGNNEKLAEMVDKGKDIKEAFKTAIDDLNIYAGMPDISTLNIEKYKLQLQAINEKYDIDGLDYGVIQSIAHIDATTHKDILNRLMTGYSISYDQNVLSVVAQ